MIERLLSPKILVFTPDRTPTAVNPYLDYRPGTDFRLYSLRLAQFLLPG
jgi:hypothetical protein